MDFIKLLKQVWIIMDIVLLPRILLLQMIQTTYAGNSKDKKISFKSTVICKLGGWKEFNRLTANLEILDITKFLLLPMVYITKDEIVEVNEFLRNSNKLLPFNEEDFVIIDNCIIEHLLISE